MYAPGHPPTPPRRVPSRAWIVSMRVLFIALAVCSLGLLLWTPLLRLAIVRRRKTDWWLTGAGFLFVCVLLPILGRDGSDDPTGIDYVLIPLLLLVLAAAVGYYLVEDIRHYERLRRPAPVIGYGDPTVPGYGHPLMAPMGVPPVAPVSGAAATPVPAPFPAPVRHQQPAPTPVHPPRYQPQPPTASQPPVAPQGQPPVAPHPHAASAPAPGPAPRPSHPSQASDPSPPQQEPRRIDQVRAELDELSAYLRKEDGR
ncbi:hypothetical protein ACF1FX_10540 [Streptomyces sp. NPDC014646]|uniref:hypothetical protein n=1 Tax=unclassified Streptomyces TaxID=2593676 RepID=UPI0036FFA328